MTVKFQSRATPDLVMVGKHAHQVLKLIGKSEEGPGILETKDMPAALALLKGLPTEPDRAEQLQQAKAARQQAEEDGEDVAEAPEPDFIDEPVSLRKRAWPLVTMIERALEEGKPIVWNVTI
ncbi:MAG: DUF1840 domain-containing protein [Aquabacterium sp.]